MARLDAIIIRPKGPDLWKKYMHAVLNGLDEKRSTIFFS